MKAKIILVLLLFYQFNGEAQLSSNFKIGIKTNNNIAYEKPIMMLNKSATNYLNQQPIELTYGEGRSAFFKSLIVPGWGLFTAANSTADAKKLFLLAPICYGTLGFGLYSRHKSNELYNQYMSSVNQSEMDELYDESSKYFRNSATFASIGAGLWIGQALYTYLYGKKNEEYRERLKLWGNNEFTSIRMTPEYDPFSNSFNVRSSLIIKLK